MGLRVILSSARHRPQVVNFTLGHYGAGFASNCFYDSECINNATLKDPRDPGTARNWRYQKCRELAFLQPAPGRPRLAAPVVLQLLATRRVAKSEC